MRELPHFYLVTATSKPADVDEKKARRLLEKAEQSCLISNSLACSVSLETRIETD